MKDILCVAAFVGKVLCLMVFVTILKPEGSIGAAWTSTISADRRMERSGMQECDVNVFAAPQAGAKSCIARPRVAHW
ncbi:hypothetical protein AB8Z38_33820 [Bradyrhizobium sp. LLZ17]|uniref:Secreted protein n=1 Tax=Bradyrhizobium sp. LLZ17 TaxID=3239388 RepID=A0AB39XJ78_9BRAD